MTPEEEALLRARLGVGGASLMAPAVDRLSAFRDKVFGTPSLSMPAVPESARGLLPERGRNAADIVEGTEPGDPLAISRKTQAALGSPSAGPEPLREMDTPLASVSPGPQLNPGLGQIGRPMGGGMGGAPGGDLKSRWEYAQKQGLDELGAARELTGDLGAAQRQRTELVAGEERAQAAQMRSDAEQQKAIEAEAHDRVMRVANRTEQLAAEIGKSKVDATRFMRNKDTATQVVMNIGAIAGGMLQGMNGGSNPFLDRLDRLIEQDIAEQQSEIDGKKAQLSANQSLFGQLLAESGDRRVAADQTRRLMYEAAKVDLKAKSDQWGIPEAKAATDLAMNGIDQKIADINANGAKAAYETYLKQAAAAAAARQAAERRQYEMMKDLAEFGLKKDHLEIERQKALGLTGEDINKQTWALGKELSDPKLAEGRAAVDDTKRRLAGLKPDEGLPGVGRMADFRNKLRPEGINVFNPLMQGANAIAGLSDNERVSRLEWERTKEAYIRELSGAAIGKEEKADLIRKFEGAKTPAEQRKAVELADKYYTQREDALEAGVDPRARQAFRARKAGLHPAMPSTVEEKK